MTVRVALHAAGLRYGGGIRLHTARSGPVDALEEPYLVVERDGAVAGVGAVRANVAYLTGVPADAVPGAIRALVEALDWRAGWPTLLDRLHAIPAPAVARCAIDAALHDAAWTGGSRSGSATRS